MSCALETVRDRGAGALERRHVGPGVGSARAGRWPRTALGARETQACGPWLRACRQGLSGQVRMLWEMPCTVGCGPHPGWTARASRSPEPVMCRPLWRCRQRVWTNVHVLAPRHRTAPSQPLNAGAPAAPAATPGEPGAESSPQAWNGGPGTWTGAPGTRHAGSAVAHACPRPPGSRGEGQQATRGRGRCGSCRWRRGPGPVGRDE